MKLLNYINGSKYKNAILGFDPRATSKVQSYGFLNFKSERFHYLSLKAKYSLKNSEPNCICDSFPATVVLKKVAMLI